MQYFLFFILFSAALVQKYASFSMCSVPHCVCARTRKSVIRVGVTSANSSSPPPVWGNTNLLCLTQLEFSELRRVYMSSGYCYHPPQPTVHTTKTEVCSFTKDDDKATGAVGVLTYDLFHMQSCVCSERMAIMFSVPYDYNFYKNWLGVGVFEVARACDKQLYNHMYKEKDFSKFVRSEASGSGVEYKAQHVDLRATMSNVGKSIIKVELYDKMGRQ
uniref:Actinoporin-like protein n=1 Tax=Hucho hucho TaxID=62062 RepID=A0A4W5PAR0_9TELE